MRVFGRPSFRKRNSNANTHFDPSMTWPSNERPTRATTWPDTGDDLAGRVAYHVAFDITSTRIAPRFTASLDRLAAMRLGIADNGNGGAIAIGAEIAHWRDLDLLSLGVEMDLKGRRFSPVFTGENWADPVATLVDTVNDLASRGLFFRAGIYPLTGSLSAPQPIGKGARAIVDFQAMGRLAVELI
jgi:2-keto-4-pentenoate hydratase